jgi:hypothetical protein
VSIKEEFRKAYGEGVIGHLEKLGAVLTEQEKELVVAASWDGVWYGFRVGVAWTVIAGGLLALVLRW